MKLSWMNLSEQDRDLFRAVIAFLNGRLEERAAVDWALRLKPNETIRRLALLDLFLRYRYLLLGNDHLLLGRVHCAVGHLHRRLSDVIGGPRAVHHGDYLLGIALFRLHDLQCLDSGIER